VRVKGVAKQLTLPLQACGAPQHRAWQESKGRKDEFKRSCRLLALHLLAVALIVTVTGTVAVTITVTVTVTVIVAVAVRVMLAIGRLRCPTYRSSPVCNVDAPHQQIVHFQGFICKQQQLGGGSKRDKKEKTGDREERRAEQKRYGQVMQHEHC